MAAKNTGRKNGKKSGSAQAIVIFWLMFFIVVTGIFMLNRETIRKNYNLLINRLSGSPGQSNEMTGDEKPAELPVVSIEQPVINDPPPAPRPEPQIAPTAETPAPATTPAPVPGQRPQAAQPPAQPERPSPAPMPAETRERYMYFTNVANDGQILRSRVSRNIKVSASPLQDALNALLAGPTAEERGRGIISLIPQNTRILSILIRGSTAYISFSEDFQFNTYGVEGYAAQVRQIVWTATEFPTVKDVQILIEGRRIDYLGEGIWIGSPVDRQSL